MKINFAFFILFISTNLFAKGAKGYDLDAMFRTKNVWQGRTAISRVIFRCSTYSGCSWEESEIDGCFLNKIEIYVHFNPSISVYSTSGEYPAFKMKIKGISQDVFSVSLDKGGKTTAEYVVSLNCSKRNMGYCEVKSVTGSWVDASAQRTTYDLFNYKDLKDLKLDRCQP